MGFGRDALIDLSKQAAAEMDVNMERPEEEVQAELQLLKEHREARAQPRKWVKETQVQADIQHTFENVNKEVCREPHRLEKVTDCTQLQRCYERAEMEYAVVVCKRVAVDNFPSLVGASPAMRQAMLAVTKTTFDKLVLKAEGFIISGVEGTHPSIPVGIHCLTSYYIV